MTTCARSRRHTLPSSSPITPAPITARRFGTASRSSAPQESTISGGLKGAVRSSIGAEQAPSAVVSDELHLATGEELAVALQPDDARGLKEREDPLGHTAHDAALALLHLCQIERRPGDLDTVDGE